MPDLVAFYRDGLLFEIQLFAQGDISIIWISSLTSTNPRPYSKSKIPNPFISKVLSPKAQFHQELLISKL